MKPILSFMFVFFITSSVFAELDQKKVVLVLPLAAEKESQINLKILDKIEKYLPLLQKKYKADLDFQIIRTKRSLQNSDKIRICKESAARWIMEAEIGRMDSEKVFFIFSLYDGKTAKTFNEVEIASNQDDNIFYDSGIKKLIYEIARENLFFIRDSDKSQLSDDKRLAVLDFDYNFIYDPEFLKTEEDFRTILRQKAGGKIEIIDDKKYVYSLMAPQSEYDQPERLKKIAEILHVRYLIYGRVFEEKGLFYVYAYLFDSQKNQSYIEVYSLKEIKNYKMCIEKIRQDIQNTFFYTISKNSRNFLFNPKPFIVYEYSNIPTMDNMNLTSATYSSVIPENDALYIVSFYSVMNIDLFGRVNFYLGEFGGAKGQYYTVSKSGKDDKGNIYLFDFSAKKIIVFNSNKLFEKEIVLKIPFTPLLFAVSSKGNAVVGGIGNPEQLFFFNSKTETLIPLKIKTNGYILGISYSNGCFSVLSKDAVYYTLDYLNDNGEAISQRDFLLRETVTAYYEDKNKNLYLGVEKGFAKLDAFNQLLWYADLFPNSRIVDVQTDISGKIIYLTDNASNRIFRLEESQIDFSKAKTENEAFLEAVKEREKNPFVFLNWLDRALEINPDYLEALKEKADFFMRKKLYQKAEDTFQKMLRIVPDDLEILKLLKHTKVLKIIEQADFFALKFNQKFQEIGFESAKKFYEDAMRNYETALKTDPENLEAKSGFENLKNLYQKLSGKIEIPGIEISALDLKSVYSSIYKFYSENPMGEIKIKNTTGKTIEKIWAEFEVKEFMDYPTESRIYRNILPDETKNIFLFSVFNNNVLNITEDTPISAGITVKYVIGGKEYQVSKTESFYLYNRNAMTWDEPKKLASFITPKDTVVKSFARQVTQVFRYADFQFLNKPLQSAVKIFDALGTYGITYVSDPKTPFTEFSKNKNQVDYIQYPRDVMRFKTGDCDDLSVLFSSLLENIGIETAMILVPGHILMMFDTGLPASKRAAISSNLGLTVVYDGRVFIPVETTLLGKSFLSAWEKGSETLLKWQGKAEFILSKTAWKDFSPATLKDIDWEASMPDKERVEKLFYEDMNQLIERELEAKVNPLIKTAIDHPADPEVLNKIGVAYARYGKYSEAESWFLKSAALKENYLPALNNLGNLYQLQKKYENALAFYEKAKKADEKNALVYANLAVIYKILNRHEEMKNSIEKALALNPSLKEKTDFLTDENSQTRAVRSEEDSLLWAE